LRNRTHHLIPPQKWGSPLCLHQHNLYLIACVRCAFSGHADHLVVQIPDRFFIAVEMYRDGRAIQRISEVDRCAYVAGVAGL
jgi:hypothetical protein